MPAARTDDMTHGSLGIAGQSDENLRRCLLDVLVHLSGTVDDHFVDDVRADVLAGRAASAARSIAWAVCAGRCQLTTGLALRLGLVLDATAADDEVGDPVVPGSSLSDDVVELAIDHLVDPSPAFRFEATADDDRVVTAVIATLRSCEGVLSCWQIVRRPIVAADRPAPVLVAAVEVDDTADPLAVTASVRDALASVGRQHAMVEVFAVGTPLPPLLQAEIAAAPPIWSDDAVDLELAPVFDHVVDHVGTFDPDREVVDPAGRRELVAALESGFPLVEGGVRLLDVIAPDRGDAVPTTLRTDGAWIWSDATTYYLEVHGIVPHQPLVRHLTERGSARPRVSAAALQRATELVIGPVATT